MTQTNAHKIRLHKDESISEGRVSIIRLADSSVKDAEPGQECQVSDRSDGRILRGRIIRVATKRLGDLAQEDARHLVGGANEAALRDLRSKLRQYRFRPQWEGEDTRFRILEIAVDSD